MVKYCRLVLITALLLILALTGCTADDAESIGRTALILDAADHTITNVGYPVNDTDAATKGYVDDSIAAIPVYTYWDDMVRTVISLKAVGVKAPAESTAIGGYSYAFADVALEANEQEVQFIFQLPHSYIEGTDIVPHLHYAYPVDQVNTASVWGIDYYWTNFNEERAAAVSTAYCTTRLSNNDSLFEYLDDFTPISGTGMKISSIIRGRLYRHSSVATDNFTDAVNLIDLDIHYQTDGKGSESEDMK